MGRTAAARFAEKVTKRKIQPAESELLDSYATQLNACLAAQAQDGSITGGGGRGGASSSDDGSPTRDEVRQLSAAEVADGLLALSVKCAQSGKARLGVGLRETAVAGRAVLAGRAARAVHRLHVALPRARVLALLRRVNRTWNIPENIPENVPCAGASAAEVERPHATRQPSVTEYVNRGLLPQLEQLPGSGASADSGVWLAALPVFGGSEASGLALAAID